MQLGPRAWEPAAWQVGGSSSSENAEVTPERAL